MNRSTDGAVVGNQLRIMVVSRGYEATSANNRAFSTISPLFCNFFQSSYNRKEMSLAPQARYWSQGVAAQRALIDIIYSAVKIVEYETLTIHLCFLREFLLQVLWGPVLFELGFIPKGWENLDLNKM